MPIQMPPDPKPEEKSARELSPMTILQEGGTTQPPAGIVHPSKSINHAFSMNDEVEYSDTNGDAEADPTPEDRSEPLLMEVDPNALKGAPMET